MFLVCFILLVCNRFLSLFLLFFVIVLIDLKLLLCNNLILLGKGEIKILVEIIKLYKYLNLFLLRV